jgi:heterodisulfide reductase subunit B
VASYYGCLLARPPEIAAFENPDQPVSIDDLAAVTGAEPVDWPYKTECCGASLSMTHTDVVRRLSHRLLSMAHEAGAECVIVACPMCQVNLDLRQPDAVRAYGPIPEMPVLYITQLLGLALGLTPKELGLDALTISPTRLLKHRRRETMVAAGGSI